MGMINIQLAGSFGRKDASFSAMEGGHAAALSRAIGFLNNQLEQAIRQDHQLHDQGHRPPQADFGRTKE